MAAAAARVTSLAPAGETMLLVDPAAKGNFERMMTRLLVSKAVMGVKTNPYPRFEAISLRWPLLISEPVTS